MSPRVDDETRHGRLWDFPMPTEAYQRVESASPRLTAYGLVAVVASRRHTVLSVWRRYRLAVE